MERSKNLTILELANKLGKQEKKKVISTTNLPPGERYPIQNCRKVKTQYGEKLVFEIENYIVYLPPRMNGLKERIKEFNEAKLSFEVVPLKNSKYPDLKFHISDIDEEVIDSCDEIDEDDENDEHNVEEEENNEENVEEEIVKSVKPISRSTKKIVEQKDIKKNNKPVRKNVKEITEDEINSDIDKEDEIEKEKTVKPKSTKKIVERKDTKKSNKPKTKNVKIIEDEVNSDIE